MQMFKSKQNWASHLQWMVQQVKQDQEEEKTASLKQVDKLEMRDEIIKLEICKMR